MPKKVCTIHLMLWMAREFSLPMLVKLNFIVRPQNECNTFQAVLGCLYIGLCSLKRGINRPQTLNIVAFCISVRINFVLL